MAAADVWTTFTVSVWSEVEQAATRTIAAAGRISHWPHVPFLEALLKVSPSVTTQGGVGVKSPPLPVPPPLSPPELVLGEHT
jgi:hypothetical protein